MAGITRADDGLKWQWLHPRFWGAWLACALIVLLAWLPWAVQRRLGAGLGALAYRLVTPRVNDTRINLRLCFPERPDTEIEAMVRDVFRQGGIGLFEAANAWFAPLPALAGRVRTEGVAHVQAAASLGRGVIILGAHYTSLDLNGAMAAQHFDLQTVYRPQNNPVLDWFIRRGRRRNYSGQIDHADMRSLFKALKGGNIVWTAVDQDYGLKQGVMAPFFGVPAATLTATARMARINDSPVLFTQFFRNPDETTYTLRFTPVLDGYPSGDEIADVTRINAELARLIRENPTQYMWFHRRFKSQPAGTPSPYPPKRKHRS